MRDWILGLQKAAAAHQPGATDETLRALEAELGEAMPDELRDLYRSVNGAVFPSDVVLYSLRAGGNDRGVLEKTRVPMQGLPQRGTWRFGLRGFGEHLFAAQKMGMVEYSEGLDMPAWFASLAPDAWLFGMKSEDTGELTVFKTLEQLLWTLIPPAEAEEFGENTFARALSAVEKAVGELQASPEGTKAEGKASARKAKAKKPAAKKPAAKKPAAKKPARRKPARAATGAKARSKGGAKKPKPSVGARKKRPARRG